MSRRISVVINTYNRASSLRLTLDGLQRLDPGPALEVVVVNGPSTDATDEVLAEWEGRIKHLVCPERNLSMSRNIGVAAAAGDVVAFIDDDAYPDPAWLTALDEAFDDPEVVAAGGPVFDYTGARFQAVASYANRLGDAWVPDPDEVVFPGLFDSPGSRTFPYTIGTNSAFRRERLVEVGGFDEEFEYYLDETDVCARLTARGWVVRTLAEGFVYHKFLASDVRNDSRALKDRYAVLKNHAYFALKHGRGLYSWYEIMAGIVGFAEKNERDYVLNVEHGLLTEADLERFRAERHRATDDGVAAAQRGHDRTRPREFYADPPPFVDFPRLGPAGRRLHVCYLSQEYPPGRVNGIGRIVHTMATGLAAAGHVVRVLTVGEHHDRVDLEDGVWVHRIVRRDHEPVEHNGVPGSLWSHARTMLDELERIDRMRPIDVVQAPNWDSEGVAAMAEGRWPIVLGLYTPLSAVDQLDPALAALNVEARGYLETERWCLDHADVVLASGPAIVGEVEAAGTPLDRDRLELVAHGILPPAPSEPARSGPIDACEILFVGRLERRKGIDTLLAAVPLVLAAQPATTFTIVGDDTIPTQTGRTFHEEFRTAHPELEASDAVAFLGRVDEDELAARYAGCDVFVAPSRFESFGLVLVEAMARRKAVVAGRCPGMALVVGDEGAGLLVDPDDPAELAAVLIGLVESPERRAELGEAGFARYDSRYRVERMVADLVAVYERAITRGKRETRPSVSARAPA